MAKPIRVWSYNGLTLNARTKSEARARYKRYLSVKRLPVGAKIVEVKE